MWNHKRTLFAYKLVREKLNINGANIHEANYAHGKNDFIAKLQIALKECSETEYWLELLLESGYYNNKNTLESCIEIKRILIASINTAKEKNKWTNDLLKIGLSM